ncbi:hypothetical protein QVD17_02046 [Tagetes erecta]|uniref:Uncharacterized protein n=1 Tax=Tagetes erecta TaxID=13708 RepID=A0AAD8L7H9_TARER|nr:hypothetical protein QVD17_02046 [Tagetes erecta]
MDKEENLQIPPTGFSQGNEPDSESDADVLDNLKSYYNDDEGDVDMFNLEGEKGAHKDSKSDADVLDNLKSYYNDDEGDEDMFNLEGEKGAHKGSEADVLGIDKSQQTEVEQSLDNSKKRVDGGKGETIFKKQSKLDKEENLDLPPPGFNHGNESGKESKVGDLAMQIDSGKKMKEVEDASKDLAGVEGVQEVTEEEKAAGDEGGLPGR